MLKKINSNRKIIAAVVASVLLAVIMVGVLGNALDLFSKDFSDITLRERNAKNELKGTFTDYNAGDGIKATRNNDGSIKLRGKNESGADIVIPLETVTLGAGTYSLWGASNGGKNSYYIKAVTVDNSVYISDFTGNSFTLASEQAVNLYIVICDETSVYTTLKPVLCKGTENVGFYA